MAINKVVNNGPPADEDISARDLWAQIISMPRPHRLVPFPRKGEDGKPLGQIAMWPLSQDEQGQAIAAAEAFVRKVLKEEKQMPTAGEPRMGYEDLIENRRSIEILFRCCRNPNDLDRPFFPAKEQIGQKLTTDEIAVLVWNYLRVKAELGPIESEMGAEEREAWIEKLAKGGSLDPLDSLSLAAQSTLIRSMAVELWNSRMANSSPGGQPGSDTSS